MNVMIENATKENVVIPPQPAAEDLSREIERTELRQPDEQIKAIRVFGDFYRCNWWAKDMSPTAFWLSTGTIRKSRLLRATKTHAGMHVEDVTPLNKPR
jgi:hypothetical protein